jgi:hypothetical protein
MKLKVNVICDSFHFCDVVIGVETIRGVIQMVVDRRVVQNGVLEIGHPVGENDDGYLVALGENDVDSLSHVWVSKSEVLLAA